MKIYLLDLKSIFKKFVIFFLSEYNKNIMLLFEGPDDKFRASAGAFITNKERTAVLAFERINRKGSRQLPQGGIKIYETPVDGIYRELNEETGLEPKDLILLGEYPE
jgi:8-oxo-dGTP pyrophosphatase MutT (NUDIX family)